MEQLGTVYEGLLEFRLRVADQALAVVRKKGREVYEPTEGNGAGVIPAGRPYLENDKGERKATGSYYTPTYIVEYIVESAVGPVVDDRIDRFHELMGEIAPKRARLADVEAKLANDPQRAGGGAARWTNERSGLEMELRRLEPRAVDALLGIRICDPAMGSGHFLVHATDWLTERIAAVLAEYPENPISRQIEDIRGQIVANLGEDGIRIDPAVLKETSLLKRMVMKRCIYGVDLNPMATELAKLALWLDSFTVGAPLSFLDHHLKTGNSLVGTTVGEVRRALEAEGAQFDIFGGPFAGLLQATELMRGIATRTDATMEEVSRSAELFAEFEASIHPYKRILDLWVSQHFDNQGVVELLRSHGGEILTALRGQSAPLPSTGQLTVEDAAARKEEHHFFHWELEFPEAFVDLGRASWKENAGFDAVIGNPPYVRQEQMSEVKPYLREAHQEVYAGTADLYVYFYRQGVRLLRRGGRTSYIVTNKWLRAGYGERLRGYLAREAEVERIVDFGHAPIFEEADVFPVIAVFRRNGEVEGDAGDERVARIALFPRERLHEIGVGAFVDEHGYDVPADRFNDGAWSLEREEVERLMRKIRDAGTPLAEYAGVTPYRGVLTGLNEAFLIDTETRNQLVAENSASEKIIKPYLRGQDVGRWRPEWAGLWMIRLESSANRKWTWSDLKNADAAEARFKQELPAIHRHFASRRDAMIARQDQGRFWWELRSCRYYDEFDRPKLIWKDLAFHPEFALDREGYTTNDLCFILATEDRWLPAVLNSPLMWAFMWRNTIHGKDEVLRLKNVHTEPLPIAKSDGATTSAIETTVDRLLALTDERNGIRAELLPWLRTEFAVATSGRKLDELGGLSLDDFIAEVRARRPRSAGRLTPAALRDLTEGAAPHLERVRQIDHETEQLEVELANHVYAAYGLTDEEIDLLWDTAPPRMPGRRPARLEASK